MKVYFDTVGCRLNQAEIERYAAQFAAQGHELVPDTESATKDIDNRRAACRSHQIVCRLIKIQKQRLTVFNGILTGLVGGNVSGGTLTHHGRSKTAGQYRKQDGPKTTIHMNN